MRTVPAPVVLVLLCLAGCAAKIPPQTTFSPGAWLAVEAIPPGAHVGVQYVTGNPPLRRSFEGTFRSATADALEIDTKDGTQRMITNRVVRVSVGKRENRALELAMLAGLAGAMAGGVWSASLDDDGRQMTALGATAGALIGFGIGSRRPPSRPRVVYSREVR
jgi:hypothetical protein